MSELVFVKYCPLCGAENPRSQAFCLRCMDGDLTMVPVEPRRETTASPCVPQATAQTNAECIILELVDDPQIAFHVGAGQTVGRTEKADIVLQGVPKVDWISGLHARVSRRGTQWYVQHVGQTNFIAVDGTRYEGTEEVAIYDGSILVLSLTAFRVKLPTA